MQEEYTTADAAVQAMARQFETVWRDQAKREELTEIATANQEDLEDGLHGIEMVTGRIDWSTWRWTPEGDIQPSVLLTLWNGQWSIDYLESDDDEDGGDWSSLDLSI